MNYNFPFHRICCCRDDIWPGSHSSLKNLWELITKKNSKDTLFSQQQIFMNQMRSVYRLASSLFPWTKEAKECDAFSGQMVPLYKEASGVNKQPSSLLESDVMTILGHASKF